MIHEIQTPDTGHSREYYDELVKKYDVKPEVLSAEQIGELVPFLGRHPKLLKHLMHIFALDRVNAVHAHNHLTPGPEFVAGLLRDFDIKLDVIGEEVLRNLPQGPFITVSNHPFGAIDGIILIYLVTRYRPEYKVIVNMTLNHISGMRPNFILVDPEASADPKKKAVSMQGIREAMAQVRDGKPLGMFPAGAMSKYDFKKGILVDRPWRQSMVRLIKQLKVPVVPIYFHGRNTFLFDFLGRAAWQLRTLRLPSEVFRKCHSTLKVTIGEPLSVAEQEQHQQSLDEFGNWLMDKTYDLR